jgi:uncharacterized membrane protein
MAKKVNDHFNDLTDNSRAYIKSLLEYYKLDALKKSTKAIASLLRLVVIGVLLLLLFTFVSIGLSYLIGEKLNSVAYGFLVMGIFYLVLLLIFLLVGKPITESISLKFINKIIGPNDEESKDNSAS